MAQRLPRQDVFEKLKCVDSAEESGEKMALIKRKLCIVILGGKVSREICGVGEGFPRHLLLTIYDPLRL